MEDKTKIEEIKREFKEADNVFDTLEAKNRSKVELRKKVFMKLSDIDPEDAEKFKDFCDRYTDRKQFLGIKVLLMLAERTEPFVNNLLSQIDLVNLRIDNLEQVIVSMQAKGEEQKVKLPKTQGGLSK